MKRCLLLLLGATAAAAAAEKPVAFSGRAELRLHREATDAWSGGPFTRIAPLPDNAWSFEARPDLTLKAERLDLTLKPRALARTSDGQESSRAWLNEGWLRIRPLEGVSLQAGREALLWGPAMFWNPSNPFFTQNNRANPQQELAGRDFVRARWQWSRAWSVSAISQVGRGHDNPGPSRRDALKVDWIGESASASMLVAAEPHGTASWHGWAQWTASDAVILYGEIGWSPAETGVVAVPAHGPTGWAVESSPRSGRTFRTIVGGTYTFANGWSLAAEAWHNGDGLGSEDARLLGQAVSELGTQPRGPADAQLGALLAGTRAPWRRHYAGLQLISSGEATTGWLFRYSRNLDDDSGELVGQVTHTFGDRLQVWAHGMVRHGERESEYGRWVHTSTMLGVTWFAW